MIILRNVRQYFSSADGDGDQHNVREWQLCNYWGRQCECTYVQLAEIISVLELKFHLDMTMTLGECNLYLSYPVFCNSPPSGHYR